MLKLQCFVVALAFAAGQALAGPTPAPTLLAEGLAHYEALLATPPKTGGMVAGRFLLIDYSLPSNTERLYFVERTGGTWVVTAAVYVAHGSGSNTSSGYSIPQSFSDKPGSKASTLGEFRVSDSSQQTPCSTVGRCIHLDGLEAQNHNAYARAVVMHSNERRIGLISASNPKGKYFVPSKDLFGRSNGCPVVADEEMEKLLVFATPDVFLYVGRSSAP